MATFYYGLFIIALPAEKQLFAIEDARIRDKWTVVGDTSMYPNSTRSYTRCMVA